MHERPQKKPTIGNMPKEDKESFIREVLNLEKYVKKVCNKFLYNKAPNDIDDCVQDTLLDATKMSTPFDRNKGNIKSWLSVIASRKAFNRIEEIKKIPIQPLAPRINEDGLKEEPLFKDTNAENPELSLIIKEGDLNIKKALNKLNPNYQEIIKLRFYEDLSYEEIVERLSIPEGTVMSRLNRAKKQLAEYLNN